MSSRQFTDGEIVAAIRDVVAEDKLLSRVAVRRKLGGGSSRRIDALISEHRSQAPNQRSRPGPALAPAPARDAPVQGNGSATAAAAEADQPDEHFGDSVARLESEVRMLKILLESERKARADDTARHEATVDALMRELASVRGGQGSGRA